MNKIDECHLVKVAISTATKGAHWALPAAARFDVSQSTIVAVLCALACARIRHSQFHSGVTTFTHSRLSLFCWRTVAVGACTGRKRITGHYDGGGVVCVLLYRTNASTVRMRLSHYYPNDFVRPLLHLSQCVVRKSNHHFCIPFCGCTRRRILA